MRYKKYEIQEKKKRMEEQEDSQGSVTGKKCGRGLEERVSEREKKWGHREGQTTWNPLPRAPSGTPPHHHTPPLQFS